jgi:hypothetical protein
MVKMAEIFKVKTPCLLLDKQNICAIIQLYTPGGHHCGRILSAQALLALCFNRRINRRINSRNI